MSGKEKITNLTVQAIRPVSYIGSLFQMVGRIVIGGGALIAVIILWMVAAGYVQSGQMPAGFVGTEISDSQKGFNYITIGGKADSKDKLLVVDLTGMILGVPPFPDNDPYLYSMMGVTFGEQLKNQILAAAREDSIKGIMVQTSTPGGTIFGSIAIHDAIVKYQELTNKPVVVWIEGGSMSGGVYSTVGASAIYAAPGSMTGSIGVISGQVAYFNDPIALSEGGAGITTRGGIEITTLHAGKGKDFGNPYRRVTEEELAVIQGGLDKLYAEFVDHVATFRGIKSETIINEMGAHVFENGQAENYGLIDATLSRDDAFTALAVLAGINPNDFAIVRRGLRRGSFFEGLNVESTGEAESAALTRISPLIEKQKCQAFSSMALAYHGPINSACTFTR